MNTSVFTNSLNDFMVRLIGIMGDATLTGDAKAGRGIDAFWAYLQGIGVEIASFGSFSMNDKGQGDQGNFGASNLPRDFIDEYFEREWFRNDHTLRAAARLTPAMPTIAVTAGRAAIATLSPDDADCVDVIQHNADAGMVEGFSLVGRLPFPGRDGQSRYYIISLGGDAGSAAAARAKQAEIRVALFALHGLLLPRFHAAADGVTEPLSVRERDVLARVAAGDMRDEIGFRMNLAVPTVDLHLRRIREKLRAQNLPEAVAKAMRYGLL